MTMKIASVSVLICLIAGCTLYPVFTIDSKPFTNDGNNEKIQVGATVVTTPELNSYVFKGNGWAYAYTGIGQDSVHMSRQLFDEVSISETMPEPGEEETQLILVPKVIEIKEWGTGGVSLALIQEITLGWKAYAYPSLKLIYQTEETAQEKSYAGSMFNVESQAVERAHSAVQAVFKQSLKNLSASYQLHQYASIPTLVNVPHLFGTTVFQQAPFPLALYVYLQERTVPRVYRGCRFQVLSDRSTFHPFTERTSEFRPRWFEKDPL